AGDEVDTLGGYLVTKIGRVPVRGELVPGPGVFEIEVLDADPRRVKKVKIYRSKARRETREAKARETILTLPNAPATSTDQPATPDSKSSSAVPLKDTRQS